MTERGCDVVNVITGFMNAFQQPAQSVAIGILVPKELYARDSSNEQIMGIVNSRSLCLRTWQKLLRQAGVCFFYYSCMYYKIIAEVVFFTTSG